MTPQQFQRLLFAVKLRGYFTVRLQRRQRYGVGDRYRGCVLQCQRGRRSFEGGAEFAGPVELGEQPLFAGWFACFGGEGTKGVHGERRAGGLEFAGQDVRFGMESV